MNDTSQAADSPSSNMRSARLVAALAAVLGVVLLVNFVGRGQVARVSGGNGATATVAAEDGVTMAAEGSDRQLPTLVVPLTQQQTVFEALQQAAELDQRWHFAYQGSGAKAFLTELGGQPSDAATGRYWQYELNGRHAQRGIGEQVLQPGDRVLWKFGPYE